MDGWGSCCADGWLLPFVFGVVPIGMAHVALGGGFPSAPGAPSSLSSTCLLPNLQFSLIFLPDIRCETDMKFFFIVVHFPEELQLLSFKCL